MYNTDKRYRGVPLRENPYSYGGPVSGPHFTGREDELAALVSRMTNGVSVAVTGPRRYGKTSLIGRGVEELAGAGAAVLQVNLMHCPSVDALASRLATSAYGLPGATWRRARHAIPEFLSRVRTQSTVTIGEDGKPVFGFGGLGPRDAERVLDDVYAMLASLADKRPAVLILDEFHAITELGEGLAGILKALGDEHPRVSLVIASSRQHLMEALVISKGAPLYNMAERLALGPIEPAVMGRYLKRRAAAGRKPMDKAAAESICRLAGAVPYDIQRLAYESFDVATTRIAVEDTSRAMRRVVEHESPGFADRLGRLHIGQRRVLLALAAHRGMEQPYGAGFAREVGYAGPPGVRRAITALIEDETVTIRGGVVDVADPFFAEWLRGI
ncbi:MAG: AAA family ATPase [Acidimicrobiales bacterium]